MIAIEPAKYGQRAISEDELRNMRVPEPGLYQHPNSGGQMVARNAIEATEADRMGMVKTRELRDEDFKTSGRDTKKDLMLARISLIEAQAAQDVAEVMDSGIPEKEIASATKAIGEKTTNDIRRIKREES